MSAYAQTPRTEHERFMKQAKEQLLAFEQRETAFRKEVRDARAEELHLPLNREDAH